MVYGAAIAWVAVLLDLGLAARRGLRWAFWAGIILYVADMIALVVMFSMLSFAVHAIFVFKWLQGQKGLKEFNEAMASGS